MIAARATVRGEVNRKTFGSKTASDEVRELSSSSTMRSRMQQDLIERR